VCNLQLLFKLHSIRVITKLPNSEQSYKGKVKIHKYINRQNQSTTGNSNYPDLVRPFLKKLWFESDFKAPNLLNTIETVSTAIRESIFGQIIIFFFLNVDNLSVFDSNIKIQFYMFLVILVMNKINR
jgi:hypothetical protein